MEILHCVLHFILVLNVAGIVNAQGQQVGLGTAAAVAIAIVVTIIVCVIVVIILFCLCKKRLAMRYAPTLLRVQADSNATILTDVVVENSLKRNVVDGESSPIVVKTSNKLVDVHSENDDDVPRFISEYSKDKENFCVYHNSKESPSSFDVGAIGEQIIITEADAKAQHRGLMPGDEVVGISILFDEMDLGHAQGLMDYGCQYPMCLYLNKDHSMLRERAIDVPGHEFHVQVNVQNAVLPREDHFDGVGELSLAADDVELELTDIHEDLQMKPILKEMTLPPPPPDFASVDFNSIGAENNYRKRSSSASSSSSSEILQIDDEEELVATVNTTLMNEPTKVFPKLPKVEDRETLKNAEFAFACQLVKDILMHVEEIMKEKDEKSDSESSSSLSININEVEPSPMEITNNNHTANLISTACQFSPRDSNLAAEPLEKWKENLIFGPDSDEEPLVEEKRIPQVEHFQNTSAILVNAQPAMVEDFHRRRSNSSSSKSSDTMSIDSETNKMHTLSTEEDHVEKLAHDSAEEEECLYSDSSSSEDKSRDSRSKIINAFKKSKKKSRNSMPYTTDYHHDRLPPEGLLQYEVTYDNDTVSADQLEHKQNADNLELEFEPAHLSKWAGEQNLEDISPPPSFDDDFMELRQQTPDSTFSDEHVFENHEQDVGENNWISVPNEPITEEEAGSSHNFKLETENLDLKGQLVNIDSTMQIDGVDDGRHFVKFNGLSNHPFKAGHDYQNQHVEHLVDLEHLDNNLDVVVEESVGKFGWVNLPNSPITEEEAGRHHFDFSFVADDREWIRIQSEAMEMDSHTHSSSESTQSTVREDDKHVDHMKNTPRESHSSSPSTIQEDEIAPSKYLQLEASGQSEQPLHSYLFPKFSQSSVAQLDKNLALNNVEIATLMLMDSYEREQLRRAMISDAESDATSVQEEYLHAKKADDIRVIRSEETDDQLDFAAAPDDSETENRWKDYDDDDFEYYEGPDEDSETGSLKDMIANVDQLPKEKFESLIQRLEDVSDSEA